MYRQRYKYMQQEIGVDEFFLEWYWRWMEISSTVRVKKRSIIKSKGGKEHPS